MYSLTRDTVACPRRPRKQRSTRQGRALTKNVSHRGWSCSLYVCLDCLPDRVISSKMQATKTRPRQRGSKTERSDSPPLVHPHLQTDRQTDRQTHTHTSHTHARTRTRTHTHTHSYIQALCLSYTHTHTHTHTHTRTSLAHMLPGYDAYIHAYMPLAGSWEHMRRSKRNRGCFISRLYY